MPTMRRFVAILLLMLLPLQAVWAAAAPYCQHESEQSTGRDGEVATHHIGHHQPEHHHADDGHAEGQDGHGSGAAEHSDCHVCHGALVLPHEWPTVQALPSASQALPSQAGGLPAPPATRPERPNWLAFA